MTRPPRHVLDVLEVLTASGYNAVLVGGCVRDILLGRRPADWDAASSAAPEAVMGLFPRVLPTGIRHGTVTVMSRGRGVEVTAFRADGAYSDHRRPDSVRFTASLEEDLSRRDFTINAMAMGADGRLWDPFGGRADLESRIIRCVGDPETRFSEDALRMLRAYRFSAQLGFEIERDTRAAIKKKAFLATGLSPERVRDELKKTLFSPRPDVIGEMIAAGLLDAWLTRGSHDFTPLRSLPQYSRLAHLCQTLVQSGCITSARAFLAALRFDGRTVDTAAAAAAILQSGSRDWKRILKDHGADAALAAYPRNRRLRRVLKSGECWRLADLAINGSDLISLGYSGREVGMALDKLLDHVIDCPSDNNNEILRGLAQR